MSDQKPEALVVCALRDQERWVVRGSTIESCALCKKPVLVTPISQQVVRKLVVAYVCTVCYGAKLGVCDRCGREAVVMPDAVNGTEMICNTCHLQWLMSEGLPVAPVSGDEIVPNMFRERN